MSEVKVNKISPRSGTAITLGDSGDTFTIPSGATLAIAGSVTGFTSAGIDDNATSVAITIDSSERVGIGTTSPSYVLQTLNSDGGVRFSRDFNTNGGDGTIIRIGAKNSSGAITDYTWVGSKIISNSASSESGAIYFSTVNSGSMSEKMRIDNAGLVGIGTSAPSTLLHLSSTNPVITFEETDQSNRKFQIGSFGNAYGLYDATNSQYRYIVDNSGNHIFNEGGLDCDFRVESNNNANMLFVDGNGDRVGIGAVPTEATHILLAQGSNGTLLMSELENLSGPVNYQLTADDGDDCRITFGDKADNGRGRIVYSNTSEHMRFEVNNLSEKARIDASGNFMVGKTTSNYSSPGVEAKSNGNLIAVRDSGNVVNFIRNTNDGSIVTFSKDTTNFGSIGVNSGNNPYFSGLVANHGGVMFSDAGASQPTMFPVSSGSTLADNAVNIGASSYRYKDLYLGGGLLVGGTGTANKLDDYEEGTWSPTYRGSSTAGSFSVNASGTYTKVGNIVSVTAHLKNITQNSAAAGSIEIAGLPFAKSSGQESDIGSIYLNLFSLGGSHEYAVVNVNPSVSHVLITAIDSGGGSASTLQVSARQSDASDMFFSVTYTT